jgi:hypothetical protein
MLAKLTSLLFVSFRYQGMLVVKAAPACHSGGLATPSALLACPLRMKLCSLAMRREWLR